MLQILTRGRFWDNEFNTLNPVNSGEKFGVYKQNTLQKYYSKNLIKHILGCLTSKGHKQPTRKQLLEHFQKVFSVYAGTYVPETVNKTLEEAYKPTNPLIPISLTKREGAVYKKFLSIVKQRVEKTAKDSMPRTPRVFTITDLAKDYDDLMAMITLKELHRLGVVVLKGFVANLMPTNKHGLFRRGALNSLGLNNVPIGVGSIGDSKHKLDKLSHEFDGTEGFMAEEGKFNLPDGQALLKRIFSAVPLSGLKVTLLTISSLMDIDKFSHEHSGDFKEGISIVVL